MGVANFLKEIGRPVAYYPRLANAIGSVKATVFLCQLLYWQDKGHNPEGWIYKKQEEIEQETGLTRRKQESARKILVGLNLLEEERKGTHGTLHFRVNLEALDFLWSQHTSANGVNVQRPMAENANDECTNAPNANGATRHTLIKDTENTTENTHNSATPTATQRAAKKSVSRKSSKRDERKRDPRSNHPAIRLVKELTGYYPRLLLYDDVIETMGEHPDFAKAKTCALEWARRNFRADNHGWVFDWYVNGIPERNGNGRQGNSKRTDASTSGTPEVSEHARKIAGRFRGTGTAGSSL